MTSIELAQSIRRCRRWVSATLNVTLAAWAGLILMLLLTDGKGVTAILACFAIPLFGFSVVSFVGKKFGVFCPKCGAALGREKPKFYDITKTLRCRRCGERVVDEP